MLERLGRAVGVSRAYILVSPLATDGTPPTDRWYEWAAREIGPVVDDPDLRGWWLEEDGPGRELGPVQG